MRLRYRRHLGVFLVGVRLWQRLQVALLGFHSLHKFQLRPHFEVADLAPNEHGPVRICFRTESAASLPDAAEPFSSPDAISAWVQNFSPHCDCGPNVSR